MPTRCNIIVKSGISGRNILYRHCDGYPDSGTGDDLKAVLEKYSKNVEEYDYESLTKQILDSYDDIQEDDKVARDISYFNEEGYTCDYVRPFDMFPHSVHVESVVLMSRLNTHKE